MRDATSEPHVRIKTVNAELERFERTAATLLGSTVVFALALNSALIVAIF